MPDATLTCRDCSTDFVFTEREQAFFAERGWGAPVRCIPCRRLWKGQRGVSSLYLECSDCGETFEHSIYYQRLFEREGWKNPTRCLRCRTARREAHLYHLGSNDRKYS